MNILLISNDINIINKFDNKVDTINSTILVSSIADNYDYIILDEQNIRFDTNAIELLKPYSEKVGVLGYTNSPDYTFLKKDEFDIENIQIYFENETIQIKEGNLSKNEKNNLQSPKNTYILLEYIEKLSDNKLEINTILNDLNTQEKKNKATVFSFLSQATKLKVFKRANLRNKIRFLKYVVK